MAFEPFGYRFEIKSPMSTSEVKGAIRSRKKGWFNTQDGARGWIAGPIICLWFSAFDRYGPMLFGVISQDGTQTRVDGRAGSDLNGMVMISLLLPILILLGYQSFSKGDATLSGALWFIAFSIASVSGIFWMAHSERRTAEPLVLFLHDTLTDSGKRLRQKSSGIVIAKELVMTIGGDRVSGVVTPNAIHDALINLGINGFVALEEGPEMYIQTAFRDGAYIVEKRDGGSSKHFRAIRDNVNPRFLEHQNDLFEFEEVRELFMSYASQASTPHFMIWKKSS